MTMKCQVCSLSNSEREQIEELREKKVTLDNIVEQLGLERRFRDVIYRHCKNCVPKRKIAQSAVSLLAQTQKVTKSAQEFFEPTQEESLTIEERAARLLKHGEHMIFASAGLPLDQQVKIVNAAKGLIETYAKVSGQMNDPLKNPQLRKILEGIMEVVGNCSDCAPLVQDYLEKLNK